MEASNILHHKSYLKGALTVAERLQMIHGRVIARQILMWIFRNYAFEEDRSMETFYWRYLAHQLKTLCQIKHQAELEDIKSFGTDCIVKKVKAKIDRSFVGLSAFHNAWRDLPEEEILEVFNGDIADDEVRKKFTWSLKERYTVIVRRAEPENTTDLGKCRSAQLKACLLIFYTDFSRPPGFTCDDVDWAKQTSDEYLDDSTPDDEAGKAQRRGRDSMHRRKRRRQS